MIFEKVRSFTEKKHHENLFYHFFDSDAEYPEYVSSKRIRI